MSEAIFGTDHAVCATFPACRFAHAGYETGVDPPQIADDYITAPERPGHGLRFKDEVRREFVLRA